MQDDFSSDKAPAQWLEVLALVLLVGPHWLLWRDLFDGAAIWFAAMTGYHDGLVTTFRNANWFMAIGFHETMLALAELTNLPYLLFVKLLITALILGLYVEFRHLGQGLFGLTRAQARQAALLAVASPALYTLASSQIVLVLLCVWLVFVGHRLYRQAGWPGRAAGLVLLALSFQLNSNLVFALALEMVLLVRLGSARTRRLGLSLLLLATAVAVYAGLRWMTPPQQIFTEYNRLLMPWRPDDLRRIVRAVLMFLTWGVLPLGAMLISALCLLAQGGWRRPVWREPLRTHGPLLLAAAFLCASAAFPYVMVGKGPPLFTIVSQGDGLTEQVLRAVYAGPFAPTWSSSSGRHALLYAAAMGFLSWGMGRLVWDMLGGAGRSRRGVFALTLLMFLSWALPADYNKLETQFVEQSLVGGFKTLPAAPPGIVELQYRPASDWIVWTQSAGMVLRQAWGRTPYWPIFYSVEPYRLDMQWQYHAYLRNTGGLARPEMQHYLGVEGLPNEDCISRYRAELPPRRFWQVLAAGLWPGAVPAASIVLLDTDCQKGRILPNPSPEKILIP